MKKKNFWAIMSTLLLIILISILIPSSVIAQGPAADTRRALSTFEQVFRYIEKNYVEEIDPEVLLEGALTGLFESLDDPHSAYLAERALRSLGDTTEGQFGGVGMYIEKDAAEEGKDAFIRVIAPIQDTPSARLGVRSNDLIVDIAGESTADFTIDEAVNALRGEIGTSVEVKIRRGTREFALSITRTAIEVPTIRYGTVPNSTIGYIRITQFTPFTADRIEEAINEFEATRYKALIVDVRQNPGGLLSSVVDVSGLFLDGGLIVGTSGRNKIENRMYNATKGTKVPTDTPMVVLIDAGSASASEILAGALGDRDRAVLIGQTSFGKGSVQQIRRAGDGAFRLTMSTYYTPSGNYIDKIGIIPDILSEMAELTEDQALAVTELLSARGIEKFVQNRTQIPQQEIDRFVAETARATSLEKNVLEKLVRDEVSRANNIIPVFDLEFDTVLRHAIDYLQSS